jgi:arylformamidase
VVVLEGLDLSGAREGEYDLRCLPLRIVDGDGGPCRAMLVEK